MKFGLYEPKNNPNIEYVTTSEIVTSGTKFHPGGLFSDEIWQYSDDERKTKIAAIDLSKSGFYIHPKILMSLSRQKIIHEGILGKGVSFKDGQLELDEEGLIGPALLYEIITNISKYKEVLNPVIFQLLEKYKEKSFITSIYVIPPALRDATIKNGKIESIDPINHQYINLIRYSKSIYLDKKTLTAHKIEYSNFSQWYKIQNQIQEIYMTLQGMLGKKEGFIRQNVLGKRVDFSARVVAGVNPKLTIGNIQVPYKVIAKLFEPYIGYHVFKDSDIRNTLASAAGDIITENSFTSVITKYKNGNLAPGANKIIEKIIDSNIVNKYPILVKRDPSLHRLSWQSFEFTCVEDDVVFVPPLSVEGFNLDFDGDQLALYAPLTREAQRQVRERMSNQHVNPGSGKLSTSPSQDINLATYILTRDTPSTNVSQIKVTDVTNITYNKSYNVNTPVTYNGIKGKNIVTTYGRYIYNMLLPKNMPFYNDIIKGKMVGKHMQQAQKVLDDKSFNKLATKITEISGIVNNMYPTTIAPEELKLPDSIKSVAVEILSKDDFVTAQARIKSEVIPKVKKWLKSINSGLYDLIESGARGSWNDVEQLLVAKGFISDNEGRVIEKPIISSLSEGLNPMEIVNIGSATAKGSFDRSKNTGETGYLERQLVFAGNSVTLNEKDCNTKKYLQIEIIDESHASLFMHRFCKEVGLITENNLDKIIGKKINVRSPMFCQSKTGICETCYGTFHKIMKSKNVGIIAATSLGERGSQLMMRTFHTGGRAEGGSSMAYLSEINKGALLEKTIKQVKNKIFANDIQFDIEVINDGDYSYVDDVLLLKSGVFTIHVGDESEDIVIDNFSQKIGVEFKVGKLSDNSNNIRFPIAPKSEFGKIVFMTADMSQQVKEINATLQGKRASTSDELYLKMHNNYGAYGILSVHYELITMQMTRSKDNDNVPWRLMPDSEQLIVGIKKVPYLDSPMLGIAFENIGKGIEGALLNDKENIKSPLDDLMQASLDPEYTFNDLLKG